MKCKEIEQLIYGYRELRESERKVVDKHVRQCTSCMRLLLEMQQQFALVRHAATQKPSFKNAHRFADSVMRKIEPAKQVKKLNPFIRSMELTMVRYAFAVVSILLITTFFIELRPTNHKPVKNPAIATTGKAVTLKTTSILKNVLEKKSKTNSPKITSLYLCVTVGDCDSPLIKIYSLKN